MKKIILIFIILIIFLTSCENQEGKYCQDYFKLYIEIVAPSLEILDNYEFLEYYTQEEIINKIDELKNIINKIKEISKDGAIGIENSLIDFEFLKNAKNYFVGEKEKLLDYTINGILGYKYTFEQRINLYTENIKNYNEYYNKSE